MRNLGYEYVESYLNEVYRDKIIDSIKTATEQESMKAVKRKLKDNPAEYVYIINNIMNSFYVPIIKDQEIE